MNKSKEYLLNLYVEFLIIGQMIDCMGLKSPKAVRSFFFLPLKTNKYTSYSSSKLKETLIAYIN